MKSAHHSENPPHLDGVGDMSLLIYLDAPNVLHNLICRYNKREIYTSISKILLAVNPYHELGIYGEDVIMTYKRAAHEALNAKIISNPLPPHVFSISQVSHMNLLRTNLNQSMIVCGESGSGKTESAKYLLRYLAFIPQQEAKGHQLERQVIEANPILESFGNAKTLLNDNSSRFGKFTKVVYAEGNQSIVGSFIETYLLEKSRVVHQDKGERNYHIFYMLTHSSVAQNLREKLHLTQNNFHYTSQSGCTVAEGWQDEPRFLELCNSFAALGIDEEKTSRVFSIVSAVLHLGNVNFTPDADAASVSSMDEVQIVAELLQIPAEQVVKRLTTSTIHLKDQAITKKFSHAQAVANRDSMAKALYNGLFEWLVNTINSALYSPASRRPGLNWIGILDVFGFECFEQNSFEQFCINFANERLQQFFNVQLLESEQQEYLSQSIVWDSIYIASNQDVIDLIDGRPQGILAILNSACKLPKADDETFTTDLFQLQGNHKRLKQLRQMPKQVGQRIQKVNAFSIHHYAGEVIYNAKDFLTKNNDNASVETIALFEASQCTLTSRLIAYERGATATKSFTVGSTFSRQLGELVDHLDHTVPYFIRCIKPNTNKQAFTFDTDYVLPQLKCGGIIEALRILKLGYPTRCSYEQIWERYASLCQLPRPEAVNKRDFTEAIMVCSGGKPFPRSEYQLGLTKIFFRPGKQQFLESLLSSGEPLPKETVEKIRKYLLFKRFRRSVATIQANMVFANRLREIRAAQRISMAFGVMNIINKTIFAKLRAMRARKLTAGVHVLQACARSTLAALALQQQKDSAKKITAFYKDAIMHRRLRVRVAEMIETKQRTANDEKESREKEVMEAKLRKEKARQDTITVCQTAKAKRAEGVVLDSDPVVSLLSLGHSFTLDNATIYLCCNPKENGLQWISEDETVVGFCPLRRVDRIHLHKSQDATPSLVFLKAGNEQIMQLLPVSTEPAAYLFWWLVGLRYLLQNLKDVGSVSREPSDPLRANMLAWQLMLQNEELARKLVNMEQKCKSLMVKAGVGATLTNTLRRKREDAPTSQETERKDNPPLKKTSPSRSQLHSENLPQELSLATPSASAQNSPVRASPRSPVGVAQQIPIVIWFPDGSRTTLHVSNKSSTTEVIMQMAQTIALADYDGFTSVHVHVRTCRLMSPMQIHCGELAQESEIAHLA